MENWCEIYKNKIPYDNYKVSVKNGEENGLIILLESKNYIVNINFGYVVALRMLEEGIVLNGLFDDKILNNFKNKGFLNIIYKINGGEFDNFLRSLCKELYDYCNYTHYAIITINYIIEIISEWEPNIEVINK